MANLILTQTALGLKIVTDNSTFIINEFSVKRNNNTIDEFEIISDLKNNYAEFKVKIANYTSISFDGNVVSDIDTLIGYLESIQSYSSHQSIDEITGSKISIDYAHHEIHAGNSFYVMYSVASLGAMTTPDDLISIDFKTPDSNKYSHLTFQGFGSADMRLRLIEAYTGGAESPTGQLTILNHNRASSNTSTITNGTNANQVNYDSTLATGGVTLWDQYLQGSGVPQAGGVSTGGRNELKLKPNTVYQLSIYGTDTNPATLIMDWYEHVDL